MVESLGHDCFSPWMCYRTTLAKQRFKAADGVAKLITLLAALEPEEQPLSLLYAITSCLWNYAGGSLPGRRVVHVICDERGRAKTLRCDSLVAGKTFPMRFLLCSPPTHTGRSLLCAPCAQFDLPYARYASFPSLGLPLPGTSDNLQELIRLRMPDLIMAKCLMRESRALLYAGFGMAWGWLEEHEMQVRPAGKCACAQWGWRGGVYARLCV